MTLAVAVGVSMVVSLTTTPMMCAYFLRPHSHEGHGWLYRANEWVFQSILRLYEITLVGPAASVPDVAGDAGDHLRHRAPLH